jgi:hypothetical protein
VGVEVCRHTGPQMCAKCSWTHPYEAAMLVARGRTARRALLVAAIVGTVLSLVNQAQTVLSGTSTTGAWVRVAVNYAVPFIVASMGYLSGRRTISDSTRWPQYLAGYHNERPGITELLLGPATDRRHDQPYPWLVSCF